MPNLHIPENLQYMLDAWCNVNKQLRKFDRDIGLVKHLLGSPVVSHLSKK